MNINTNPVKHIVCYSGGHSSALVAIEVVRKFGSDDVVLLNHDINKNVEAADVKRFKKEVADYLGLPITYANIKGLHAEEIPDQFDVVISAKAFKVGNGSELCTSRLKTEPFMKYLSENHPNKDCIIYYGFDPTEMHRIQRRIGILGGQGFKTDYPLALWKDRTINQTIQIGIMPPLQYDKFKHGNCFGCLKAGRQHWYIVYCLYPEIYNKGKYAESVIGYTIDREYSLQELEPTFEKMRIAEIPQTEHIKHQTFWALVRKSGIKIKPDESNKPCECVI